MAVIVVGGMIGLGKTSVATLLGQALHSEVFFESVDDNPILPLFYTASPEEIEKKKVSVFTSAALFKFEIQSDQTGACT